MCMVGVYVCVCECVFVYGCADLHAHMRFVLARPVQLLLLCTWCHLSSDLKEPAVDATVGVLPVRTA